jgi:hypothetical protein
MQGKITTYRQIIDPPKCGKFKYVKIKYQNVIQEEIKSRCNFDSALPFSSQPFIFFLAL